MFYSLLLIEKPPKAHRSRQRRKQLKPIAMNSPIHVVHESKRKKWSEINLPLAVSVRAKSVSVRGPYIRLPANGIVDLMAWYAHYVCIHKVIYTLCLRPMCLCAQSVQRAVMMRLNILD